MEELIENILMQINKEENNCFDLTDLNTKELKKALKEEGLNKHSDPVDIKEGILDLFDTVGPEQFGVI